MTIHGPGTPIWASEIAAQFGGAAPHYLSEYYAGGALVPAGAAGYYGAIPASGAISYAHFYSAPVAIDATYTVTPGLNVVGGVGAFYGYSQGGYGSIDNNVFFNGATIFSIQQVFLDAGGAIIYIQLSGTWPNSGWEYVNFTESGTVSHTYTRAGATYGVGGGLTEWQIATPGGDVSIITGANVACRFANFPI